MNKDLEHLKILSICYYVFAGITAFFACVPFIHVMMGIAIVSGSLAGLDKNSNANFPAVFGWFFIAVGSSLIILGWALAIASFLAGKYLKQQKNRIFCLIVAGIACLSVPVGTTLGVFTFIVLFRDSVKPLFKQTASNNFSSPEPAPSDWR